MQFIDLASQRQRLGPALEMAIAGVVESGRYVMGPQVAELETALGAYGAAAHVVACANGTDALALPLMAWGIKPGDAVFCPSFTFVATAQVVAWLGATPVFVDIEPDTYCIDPDSLQAAITATKAAGDLTPRAVIAVDLFGQPADYPALAKIAAAEGLKLVADTAQGFGCRLDGKHPLHWADVATTSFFPAKPLGCYGDGGAVLTNDQSLAADVDSLRLYGKATAEDLKSRSFDYDPKYLNLRVGMNSRLDTLQAAILLEKLKIFEAELDERQAVATYYADGLAGHVRAVPHVRAGAQSVWAQYTIRHGDREALRAHFAEAGIPTAVYYPIPLHLQEFARTYPPAPDGLPATLAASAEVLSLPMHPYLSRSDQDRIIETVIGFKG